MKKLFTVLMMMVVLGSTAIAQTAVLKKSNEVVAVAKARAAVQSTCLAGTGDVSSSVWQSQDGNYYVYFFHTFRCLPAGTICPMFLRIAPLARVTLDSDYNVVQATCGFMWFELL